jgi:cell division initiation protein
MLKEAEFKADEILRAAQEQVAELEAHVRSLKMDRLRLLQDIDSLLARTKRFLQEEAPELFPPADVTRKMTDFELTGLDEMPPLPSVYRRPLGAE